MPDLLDRLLQDMRAACAARGTAFDLRVLFSVVRDIPYGRPADPMNPNNVVSEWRGTCSGKHVLLRALLQRLGYASRLYCHPFRIDDAAAVLPITVTREFIGQGIWDVHNYLVVGIGTKDIVVDVTWPSELGAHGFATTRFWDGASDFAIAAAPGEAIEVQTEELANVKRRLLYELNDQVRLARRERYIKALSEYALRYGRPSDRSAGIERTLRELT